MDKIDLLRYAREGLYAREQELILCLNNGRYEHRKATANALVRVYRDIDSITEELKKANDGYDPDE